MKSKSQLAKADFVRNFLCKKAPRLFWYWKWRGTVKYNPVSVVTVVLFMQSQCWVLHNTCSLSSSFPPWSTSITSQMAEMIRFDGCYHFPCQCPSNSFFLSVMIAVPGESWYTEDGEDLQFVVVPFSLIKFFDITNGWNLLVAFAPFQTWIKTHAVIVVPHESWYNEDSQFAVFFFRFYKILWHHKWLLLPTSFPFPDTRLELKKNSSCDCCALWFLVPTKKLRKADRKGGREGKRLWSAWP